MQGTHKSKKSSKYRCLKISNFSFVIDEKRRCIAHYDTLSFFDLTSSTCRPKIIREQWCDTLMPFYKHYPIDSLLVLREDYLYFHNGLRESSTLSTLMFILDNLGSHHTAIHKRTICIARSACGQLCSLLRPATALSGCANWHGRSPRYPEKPGRFVSCARSDGPCPR